MGTNGKPKLTPLESLVMNVVWEQAPCTVHDVREALDPIKPMAYNTVLTVMRILRGKGFLRSEREGRTDVYSAAVEQTEVAKHSLRDVLDRFFSGSATALVSQLLDSEQVSRSELQSIRQELESRLTERDT